ncbi:MAG: hypothetical protein GX945_02825 [Lentisphaerae bacterium]|nr:hypothetical protein [Lentisphaerota bacterium]
MRTTSLLIKIALIGLWLSGLAARADVFLYELNFDQAIGTRTFGRLTGGKDGYEDMENGDMPVQQVLTPDVRDGYNRVYLQGSGMFEAGTDFKQLRAWTQLGRDIKNPDGAASTWVLVIDEGFFTESGLAQLIMTWSLMSGYNTPAGTLELVRPDGTVAVSNMKSVTGPVVFAKAPKGSQLGAGRYEIRYRKAGVPSSAPATPEPIVDEMPWAARGRKDVKVCPLEAGKTVKLIPGQLRTFRSGAAVGVAAPGSAEDVSLNDWWQIRYILPDAIQIRLFDQVVIGYRITTSYGSADSYVTITKSGVPEKFEYSARENRGIMRGWNLLAAPPLVLLADDPGFDALAALRPLIMDSATHAYAVLSQSAQMTQCRAFWVFNAGSSSPEIILEGLNTGASRPSLHSGWNFTGVADDTKSVADLNVISAWRWNGRHYVLLKQETSLQPGIGYWLYRE